MLQLAKQQLFRQGLFHLLLDQARHGAGPIRRIETLLSEPVTRGFGERQDDVFVDKLVLQLADELVDYAFDIGHGQLVELNPGIEAIAKLRAEGALDGALGFTGTGSATTAGR